MKGTLPSIVHPDAIAGNGAATNGANRYAGANVSERIVYALSSETREQFLPQLDSFDLPPAESEWIDINAQDPASWEQMLTRLQPTVLVTGWGSPAISESFARSPEMPLKYVCHLAGSVRQIVPRSLIERGVEVSNWGTTISGCVAEHAMLLVLGALRDLPSWNPFMDQWPRMGGAFVHIPLETRMLRGKRIGLHGFGSIARELVQMLRPFGVQISAYSVGVPEDFFARHGVRRCDSLPELFSTSDIIVECEALTSSTKGTVSLDVLRCLPEAAVFVNIGRGHVVDERALAQVALEKNLRIGLDVYHEEPLPSDSPLRSLPNALLSPHIAGPTKDGFALLCHFALQNLRRHLLGEPIAAKVSLDVYDRST